MPCISFFTVQLLFKCCFVASKKGTIPKIRTLCFVVINRVLLNAVCVCVCVCVYVGVGARACVRMRVYKCVGREVSSNRRPVDGCEPTTTPSKRSTSLTTRPFATCIV